MPRTARSLSPLLAASAAAVALGAGLLSAPSGAAPPPPAPAPAPAARPAAAPDRAVEPTVHKVRIAGVDAVGSRQLPARSLGAVVARSRAVRASGYAAVGVTWAPGGEVAGQELYVRTRTGTRWSGWDVLASQTEHGPTPGSAEAAGAVPGTEPMVVGAVDAVQAKVTARGRRAPDGLRLSVIDPGEVSAARQSAPRLGAPAYPRTGGAGGVTPRPAIYSRGQWGADESMRDGFAGYGEVHGSFVHHTVNANAYSRAEVPSILRGIYAYHTQSRGWSDVGYNYLVDRFGRVWEGRWGGIGRPVIGAHTLDYNENAFAMSAIGNFDITRPQAAMVRAYGRLFAWKLSLHGVEADAAATIGGLSARAINGHRDAASTACPGRYLYARLSSIRQRAARKQAGWSGRELRRSVVEGRRPDLLIRRATDSAVLAGDARPGFHPAATVAADWSGYRWARIVGDWDRDGEIDVLARDGQRMWLLPGSGNGRFGPRVGGWSGWERQTNVAAVGDWDGDGRPDLMARSPQGSAVLHPGRGRDGFAVGYQARHSIGAPTAMFGVGRWNGDGAPDLMTRTRDGSLLLWPGNGPGGLEGSIEIGSGMLRYDQLFGVGDLDRDGHPDLVGRLAATGRIYLLPGRHLRLAAPVPVSAGAVTGLLG